MTSAKMQQLSPSITANTTFDNLVIIRIFICRSWQRKCRILHRRGSKIAIPDYPCPPESRVNFAPRSDLIYFDPLSKREVLPRLIYVIVWKIGLGGSMDNTTPSTNLPGSEMMTYRMQFYNARDSTNHSMHAGNNSLMNA